MGLFYGPLPPPNVAAQDLNTAPTTTSTPGRTPVLIGLGLAAILVAYFLWRR